MLLRTNGTNMTDPSRPARSAPKSSWSRSRRKCVKKSSRPRPNFEPCSPLNNGSALTNWSSSNNVLASNAGPCRNGSESPKALRQRTPRFPRTYRSASTRAAICTEGFRAGEEAYGSIFLEHFVQGREQLVRGVRLGQECSYAQGPKFGDFFALGRVIGQSRRGDNVQFWINAFQNPNDADAVHHGHHEVADDRFDDVLMLGKGSDSLDPVVGGEDLVRRVSQDGAEGFAQKGLVVHYENDFAATLRLCFECFHRVRHDDLRSGGQIYFELTALARLALHFNEPVMPPNDAQHRRQAQTGAFAWFLGGEERLENSLDHASGNSSPGIHDLNEHIGSGLGFGILGRGLVEPEVLGFQSQLAALRHGIAGVDAQIEQDLVQLGNIGSERPEVSRNAGLDPDALGKGFLHDFQHLLDEVPELDDAAPALRAPAQGHQLLDDLSPPLGAFFDPVDRLLEFGRGQAQPQHGA